MRHLGSGHWQHGISVTLLVGAAGLALCIEDGTAFPHTGSDRKDKPGSVSKDLTFKTRTRSIQALAFSPNGKVLATVGFDHDVQLWDSTAGTLLRELHPPQEGDRPWFTAVAFAEDGKTVFAPTSQHTLGSWEVATGKSSSCFVSEGSSVLSFALSPDARMVLVETNKDKKEEHVLHLVDRASGKDRLVLPYIPAKPPIPGDGAVVSLSRVAFAPDGTTFVTAGNSHIIQLWDTVTGKKIREFRGHETEVRSIRYSPDGHLLASCSGVRAPKEGFDLTIRLWDVTTGEELLTIDKGVNSLTFSPDGRLLATAHSDGTSLLWEVYTGTNLCSQRNGSRYTHAVAFTPDGERLASGGGDGLVSIAPVAPTDREALTDDKLTPRERAIFWSDLASTHGPIAFRAVWALSATPADAIALLKQRLRAVPRETNKVIAQLIAQLNSKEFEHREAAVRELAYLGPQAATALRFALEDDPSVEFRRHGQPLLNAAEQWVITDPDTLRAVRAVWVLERIGNADARKLLEELAAGAPDARPTQHAKAALQRLAQRSAKE